MGSSVLKTIKWIIPIAIYVLGLGSLIFLDLVTILVLPRYGLGVHIAYDVYVENNRAYIADNKGVTIMDIDNPTQPEKIGGLYTSDGAFSVIIENDIAYVASDSNGFIIANMSDPSNVRVIGEYIDCKSAHGVCVNDSLAFITSYSGGVTILDISNLASPFKIGSYSDGGLASPITVYGYLLCYGDLTSGLKVLNLTDPTSPQKLLTIPSIRGVNDIFIYDELMFLSCHGSGVQIINLSTQVPTFIGSYSKTGGEAYGVTGNTTHLYVADLQLGTYLLDITTPSQPIEVAAYSNACSHDIFFDGSQVYLADQDKYLIILDQYLDPLFSGFPLDITLQIVLIGLTLVYGAILPVMLYRKRKKREKTIPDIEIS
ncbi:MAG: LVIVD repeat-containing protein [Candidatus Hodarchaeota archaeon]